MKIRRVLSVFFIFILLSGLLTGCGGSSKSSVSYAADNAVAVESPAEAAGALEAGADTGSDLDPQNDRKWIITVDMTAETEDLDALLSALAEHIAGLEGYVEDQSIYNGSAYSGRRYRNASLTVRIPAGEVDRFTQAVSGIANVVSSSKSLEDITLQYSDTETRVKALETEQTRLLELMEQAENMTDLLEIESRLTEVRYELERYSSRLKKYDNQVDYATVYLSVEEVQEYTQVEEPGFWQRISSGFVSSLKGVSTLLEDLLILLIVASPFLVVFGGITAAIIILVRKAKKRRKAKKANS